MCVRLRVRVFLENVFEDLLAAIACGCVGNNNFISLQVILEKVDITFQIIMVLSSSTYKSIQGRP